jgi:gamma-glutamylcyclotransferase (GGCT)/AIG2-like uncharacterized protein YtfP
MIYFAYGSNMNGEQMQSRCPGHRLLGVARLPHYTLAFTRWSRAWNSGTADILPQRGEQVFGVLYDLSTDDLKRMDKLADYPHSYIRQDVLLSHQGEMLPALTYVAIRTGVFLPSRAYLAKMIRGSEQHDIEATYIAFLKTFKTHD